MTFLNGVLLYKRFGSCLWTIVSKSHCGVVWRCPCFSPAPPMHVGRLHTFWHCPVAQAVVGVLSGEVGAPFSRPQLWLALCPPGVAAAVWRVVVCCAFSAVAYGRALLWARFHPGGWFPCVRSLSDRCFSFRQACFVSAVPLFLVLVSGCFLACSTYLTFCRGFRVRFSEAYGSPSCNTSYYYLLTLLAYAAVCVSHTTQQTNTSSTQCLASIGISVLAHAMLG